MLILNDEHIHSNSPYLDSPNLGTPLYLAEEHNVLPVGTLPPALPCSPAGNCNYGSFTRAATITARSADP